MSREREREEERKRERKKQTHSHNILSQIYLMTSNSFEFPPLRLLFCNCSVSVHANLGVHFCIIINHNTKLAHTLKKAMSRMKQEDCTYAWALFIAASVLFAKFQALMSTMGAIVRAQTKCRIFHKLYSTLLWWKKTILFSLSAPSKARKWNNVELL